MSSAMPAMNGAKLTGWTIPSGELRAIAGAYHRALTDASAEGIPLPGDSFLDGHLREVGCPESSLEAMRARIRAMPYSAVYESASQT